jgi:hypothetical protein
MDSKQVIKNAKIKAKSESKRIVSNQDVDHFGFNITQVTEVMSHVLLEAIEVFNQQSIHQYESRPEECPQMKVNIVPIMFSPEHFVATGVESQAVFTLEMKQFGVSTILFKQGVQFTCERDRKNVNRWLPPIYQQFFQYIVNTSMFYNLALNPDNPAVAEAVKPKVTDPSVN